MLILEKVGKLLSKMTNVGHWMLLETSLLSFFSAYDKNPCFYFIQVTWLAFLGQVLGIIKMNL